MALKKRLTPSGPFPVVTLSSINYTLMSKFRLRFGCTDCSMDDLETELARAVTASPLALSVSMAIFITEMLAWCWTLDRLSTDDSPAYASGTPPLLVIQLEGSALIIEPIDFFLSTRILSFNRSHSSSNRSPSLAQTAMVLISSSLVSISSSAFDLFLIHSSFCPYRTHPAYSQSFSTLKRS